MTFSWAEFFLVLEQERIQLSKKKRSSKVFDGVASDRPFASVCTDVNNSLKHKRKKKSVAQVWRFISVVVCAMTQLGGLAAAEKPPVVYHYWRWKPNKRKMLLKNSDVIFEKWLTLFIRLKFEKTRVKKKKILVIFFNTDFILNHTFKLLKYE